MNRPPYLPQEDYGPMVVIAYGFVGACGLALGLALGWWWWG